MYRVIYITHSVENELKDLMRRLRSDKVAYNKAADAIESLKTAPRQYKPGNKHPLTGNRKGQWALRLTGRMRLIYEIDDGNLVVTNLEVSDHYK